MGAEIQPTFGQLLKLARKQAGMTQEELGKAVGYGTSQISMLESGKRSPDPSIVRSHFINALQLSPESPLAKLLIQLAEGDTLHHDTELVANPERLTQRTGNTVKSILGNLPYSITPIEGRTTELDQMRRRFMGSKTRLITLIGSPGTGKTRLALEAAHSNADLFPDGIWWVELASIRHPLGFIPALVHALRLSLPGTEATHELLVRALQLRHCLLVLDNFEQILEAAGPLAELIKACGHLTVLVTSRVALNLQGEHIYRVQGLALPIQDDRVSLAAARRSAAVRLLISRAQAVLPEFQLSAANVAQAQTLCERLDGLPLAIELAAAQLGTRSLEQMLAQLNTVESGWELFLSSNAIDIPDRHRSLQHAIAWSYSLLDEAGRTLFCQLGIFVGSASESAIEAVCQPFDVQVLRLLVAQNLVNAIASQMIEKRFLLLETLRHYAYLKLTESGLLGHMKQRHAEYFAALFDDLHMRLGYAVVGSQAQQMLTDQANVREALRWSLDHQTDLGLKLAASLWKFWEAWGQLQEGCLWLERFLAASSDDAPFRARARIGLAWLLRNLTNHQRAQPLFEPAMVALKANGHVIEWIDAKIRVADNLRALGRYEEAKQHLEEAIQHSLQAQASDAQATALRSLITLQANVGNYALAEKTMVGYMALADTLNNPVHQAWARAYLAEIARFKGQLRQMRDHTQEAFRLFEEIQDIQGLVYVALVEAPLEAQIGNTTTARDKLKQALRLCRDYGVSQSRITRALCYLGAIAIKDGKPTLGLEFLAASENADPQWSKKIIPVDLVWRNEMLQAARTQVPEDAFKLAWSKGANLTVDEAVLLALSDNP